MVGIGGIGMSALAQLLQSRGVLVTGSDRDESPTTQLLTKQGIIVRIGESSIPEAAELLVYSDAVPRENAERAAARERNLPEKSYFELLGEVSRTMRSIAVAGTHGKTTTTGMIAKILSDAGESPTAIIGSIVRDFGSNFLAGRDDLLVVEACEYRNHLLQLSPEILVITNIELDHTDFFPTLAALQETFRTAVEKVPESGVIVTNPNDPKIAAVLAGAKARIVDYAQKAIGELRLVGEFNRENARAALAAALAAVPQLSPEAAVHSLSQFQGSWRRFEFKGETKEGALVFDDYAHHPTAVRKTIAAAREKYPDKKIVVAFHPHLYSRTRDFMDEFASALATADEVILAPIYAAREQPIDGITSETLAEKIAALGTSAQAFASLHDVYRAFTTNYVLRSTDLLITMGAGDIYKVAEQLTDA